RPYPPTSFDRIVIGRDDTAVFDPVRHIAGPVILLMEPEFRPGRHADRGASNVRIEIRRRRIPKCIGLAHPPRATATGNDKDQLEIHRSLVLFVEISSEPRSLDGE